MAEYFGRSNVRDQLDQIEEGVLRGLKPFQRVTAEHIASLFEHGKRRVLLADEVGLGKTLVAKGVVAKMANIRKREGDDLVKVVYICSNSAIAKQNLMKLRIHSDVELSDAERSRLSMQHLRLAEEECDPDLRRRFIQLIPLTPGTSFALSSGQGILPERALILTTLLYSPEFVGPQNRSRASRLRRVMWCKRGYMSEANWKWYCESAERQVRKAREGILALDRVPSAGLGNYPTEFLGKVFDELAQEGVSWDDFVAYLDTSAAEEDIKLENAFIAALRRAFSKASMDMMDPDFVIMDEFQRFRSLISGEDNEMGMLAERFFDDHTRVLLLSATPFRMYVTRDESDDEAFGDSMQEFREVIGFLSGDDPAQMPTFKRVWGKYARSLLQATQGDAVLVAACKQCKHEAEDVILGHISRTERTSTHEMSDLLRGDPDPLPLDIQKEDIQAYMALRTLTEAAQARPGLLSTDFAKSCPYPMSFMRHYKLNKEIDAGMRKDRKKVERALTTNRKRRLWLNRDAISSYSPIAVPHARYQQLKRDVLGDSQARLLLWVPPSIPYYQPSPSSPYARSKGFSKTLVFSSWAMVPPAVACLLSYEAEQQNVEALSKRSGIDYLYFRSTDDETADPRVTPHARLSFNAAKADAFSLVYPSPYLASAFDPGREDGTRGIADVRAEVQRRIAADLAEAIGVDRLPSGSARSNTDWYAFATMLLDARAGGDTVGQVLADKRVRDAYQTPAAVLEGLAKRFEGWDARNRLRAMPDDLVEVLADAAIASPAVCALRTYAQSGREESASLAFEFGLAFVTKMRTSDATVTVATVMERRSYATSEQGHWKHMLGYCCEGNFQAMLDEYFHLLYDGDVAAAHRLMLGEKVRSTDLAPSFYKAEGQYNVDTYQQFKERGGGSRRRASTANMRMNFAVAFMETRGEKEAQKNKRSVIRAAFNSPFRPFVLVTTSVGQEGLDFHQYCRRVAHWNLPANPVDFEQREGRVNRYKSLAVRQTLARRYAEDAFAAREKDGCTLWDELFSIADECENRRATGSAKASGLLPYWGVTDGPDVVHIDRLVYNYPFSVDEDRYRYLIDAVAQYRAVLGQPNQEELLELLRRNFDVDGGFGRNFEELFLNLSPFCHEGELGEETNAEGDDTE